MRIQKYLSEQGIASRRQAEKLIAEGLVAVNGKVVKEMGVQIDPTKDKVSILRAGQNKLDQKTTIIVYKPRDIASSRMQSEGTTIYDIMPEFNHLDIVGRLDKASEGLLLLSDDGVVAKAITGDKHLTEKEYVVTVRETISPKKIQSLEEGIMLEDGMTLPCKTEVFDAHSFGIILHEGRKHQIRRMCEYLHLNVTELKRVRIGAIELGKLKSGQARTLTAKEVASLKKVLRV